MSSRMACRLRDGMTVAGQPGCPALASWWAGWSAGQVGRYLKCRSRSNDLPSAKGKDMKGGDRRES